MWVCETCGGTDTIESDGFMLTCNECGATPQDEPDRQRQVEIATGRLFDLIARTRFRNPGTSGDPYTDALILWLSVITEARKAVAPLDAPAPVIADIEFIYRAAVEAWLRGEQPECEYADDASSARAMDDEDLQHKLREIVNPPAVWIT